MIQRRLAAGGFGLFVLIGTVQALYGPAIPSMRQAFGVTSASAGLTLSAHFVGAAIGGAVLMLSIGSIALSMAPAWTVALLAALWPSACAARS